MGIQYTFGNIYVDECIYNDVSLTQSISKVLNAVDVTRDSFFTPTEIIFHKCMFKDTYFTIFEDDFIVLNNDKLIYSFNESISQFKGNYPLNITVKFDYCDFFNCKWVTDNYPKYIPVFNNDHSQLAQLSVFIEHNKVAYIEPEENPSYPCDAEYGYKILCSSVSSHINKYYLCKVSFPEDATKIYTIAGEIRSNKMTVEKIHSLVRVNTYEHDENMHHVFVSDIESVVHTPFSGKYKDTVVYTVGETIEVDEIEMRSFRSLGKGLYSFSNIDDAINYLNRVIYKSYAVMNIANGRTMFLSEFIKMIPEVNDI
jgi:hypothetical protein